MTIEAKIIADSISSAGKRLTTLQLTYPRFIHAENKTHRILKSDSSNEVYIVEQSSGLMDDPNLSRNASSSRAIPVAKMIEQVRTNPAMPIHWGKNQAGMQAKAELDEFHKKEAIAAWRHAANSAATIAEHMMDLGLHKQVVNRILEPFQWIHVVVTAVDTAFDGFFELRLHEDADPNIYELARVMKGAMDASTPTLLQPGEWHLPYVTAEDLGVLGSIQSYLRGGKGGWNVWNDDMMWEIARKVSAARCCRVSYLKHDGTNSSIEEDLALCDRLAGARPLHASPFEHQATPDSEYETADGLFGWDNPDLHGNLTGWIQHRKLVEQQHWNQ